MAKEIKNKIVDFNSTLTSIIDLIGTISGSYELQILALFPILFEKRVLNLIEKNEDYYQEVYNELKKIIEETCDETYNKILANRRHLADFFKEVSMKIMYEYETILSLNDIPQLFLQKIANEKKFNNIYNITKDDVNFLNNLFLNIFQKHLIGNQKLCHFLNTNAILKQNELLNLLQKDINQLKIAFNENIKSDEGFEIHEKNNESVEAKIKQNEMLATSKFTVINNGYIGTQKTVSIETINGDINL